MRHSEGGTARRARALHQDKHIPTLWQIADVFARYANFTFGGGSATTAVIHHELVRKRHWLDDDHFLMSFALARLTPGTNVLAFCAGVGWLLERLAGAVVALLAASIPCTLIVIVVTVLLGSLQNNGMAEAAMHGAVASAVAITVKTGWTIAEPHFKEGARWRVVVISGAAFGLHAALGIPAIDVLLLAGVVGAFLPAGQA